MTPPELLHQALVAAGIPVSGVSPNGAGLMVYYKPEATAQQITDGNALALSLDVSAPALAAGEVQKQRKSADDFLDGHEFVGILIRAMAVVIIQELDKHRDYFVIIRNKWNARFPADLIQAIPNTITLAQAKTALKAAIDAGNAD